MVLGVLVSDVSVTRAEIPGRAAAAYALPTVPPKPIVDDPAALAAAFAGAATDAAQQAAENVVGFLGSLGSSSTPGLDFYERFHVLPRAIDAGNILSTTNIAVEVFSAFRTTTQFWTGFDNNAGEGVAFTAPPTLPLAFAPMAGVALTLQITLNGPAVVDSTLDYEFTITGLIAIPITFKRVILFSVAPELPYEETLEWLTDVLEHSDFTEQRVAVRKNPRQLLAWEIMVEDGRERSILENALLDWQTRQFGLPVWHEATPLAGAITGGSTTVITVASTADADYRDGELIVVYESQTKFDVLNLVSRTATTLTVLNPPTNSYAPLADLVLVAPLRLGILAGDPRGSRFRTGQDRLSARFRVRDNDANLADASSFPTFNSKVLLDDFNFVDGTMPEEFRQRMVVLDGLSGLTAEFARPDRHRRASEKRFVVSTKAALWRVRKLLHFLRGRQVSFYLPTFSSDLVPTATMSSGASTLAVQNVGYTNFVRSRQPKNVIRVVPADGSAAFIRTIVSSTVADASTENITISGTWPSTLTPAQILRLEFVEKARLDSDAIRISHRRGGMARSITCPVVTVLE